MMMRLVAVDRFVVKSRTSFVVKSCTTSWAKENDALTVTIGFWEEATGTMDASLPFQHQKEVKGDEPGVIFASVFIPPNALPLVRPNLRFNPLPHFYPK